MFGNYISLRSVWYVDDIIRCHQLLKFNAFPDNLVDSCISCISCILKCIEHHHFTRTKKTHKCHLHVTEKHIPDTFPTQRDINAMGNNALSNGFCTINEQPYNLQNIRLICYWPIWNYVPLLNVGWKSNMYCQEKIWILYHDYNMDSYILV